MPDLQFRHWTLDIRHQGSSYENVLFYVKTFWNLERVLGWRS